MSKKTSGAASTQEAVGFVRKPGYTSYAELHYYNPELKDDNVHWLKVIKSIEALIKSNIKGTEAKYEIDFERIEADDPIQDECVHSITLINNEIDRYLHIDCGWCIHYECNIIYVANTSEGADWSDVIIFCDDEHLEGRAEQPEWSDVSHHFNDEHLEEYIDQLLEQREIDADYISDSEDEKSKVLVEFLEWAIHNTMTNGIETIKHN